MTESELDAHPMSQLVPISVAFRVFPSGDVIAIFVGDVCDEHGNWMSYQRVGQHGACSPSLLHELKSASFKEYGPLMRELARRGYWVNFYEQECLAAYNKSL